MHFLDSIAVTLSQQENMIQLCTVQVTGPKPCVLSVLSIGLCCARFAGLLLSSLALHMAAPGQRFVPEPLTFATTLLSTALPQPATAVNRTQQWLLPPEGWASLPEVTPPLNLAEVLQSPSDDAMFQTAAITGSLLSAAVGVVSRAAEVFAKLVSFPELFARAVRALEGLPSSEGFPQVTSYRHSHAHHGSLLVV